METKRNERHTRGPSGGHAPIRMIMGYNFPVDDSAQKTYSHGVGHEALLRQCLTESD